MDSLALELPLLHMDYGPLYVLTSPVKAAFRFLTLKEVKGVEIAMNTCNNEDVIDAILQRSLIFIEGDGFEHLLDKLDPAEATELAIDILNHSKIPGADTLSLELKEARMEMGLWENSIIFSLMARTGLEYSSIMNMTKTDIMSIVPGLEHLTGTSVDPEDHKEPKNVEKAKRRTQNAQQRPRR